MHVLCILRTSTYRWGYVMLLFFFFFFFFFLSLVRDFHAKLDVMVVCALRYIISVPVQSTNRYPHTWFRETMGIDAGSSQLKD